MHIAIIGRQPAIGIAELEKVFGSENIKPISSESVLVNTDEFNIENFGSILKAGKIIFEAKQSNWNKTSQKIIQYYYDKFSKIDNKISLGISAYSFDINEREVQKTGIILKRKLKQKSVNLRLIPNSEPALSTATSHHNKLGLSDNKIELIVVRSFDGDVYIAESTGSQNITSYANRDQKRPKRDAYIGMLPPKLAQIMVNLAIGNNKSFKDNSKNNIVLDPFCGTGVILQEALLMGHSAFGTDLSEKMVDYTRENLTWLGRQYKKIPNWEVNQSDATIAKWKKPIRVVVSETYLGQPFSAPPSKEKLNEVKNNCNHIIKEFLKNISSQIESGTTICIAVPAWRDNDGNFTHLPFITKIESIGYKRFRFKNVVDSDLIYFRPDQIVAREILILNKL